MSGRAKIKLSDYSLLISGLSIEKRVLFYELLAHWLTIAIRDVCADKQSLDALKLSQIKWINEILHRVTAKARVERFQSHVWAEEDFGKMVTKYVQKEPSIGSLIAWCITSSYEKVSEIDN